MLASLQRRLGTENEINVKMTLVAYAGMMGSSVKQPPVELTIAWHKPDFYYTYEVDSGKGPTCWYWLEEGKLHAVEYWRNLRGMKPDELRARGVCVTDFVRVAGPKPEAAFQLARERTKSFALVGSYGMHMLDVLREANPKAVSVERRAAGWRLREKATDFKSSFVRNSLFEDKSSAYVTNDLAEGKQPLKGIAIYPDLKRHPDVASPEVNFHEMSFSLDRKGLQFPKNTEIIKSVEVKSSDRISAELIDSLRPVSVKQERRRKE